MLSCRQLTVSLGMARPINLLSSISFEKFTARRLSVEDSKAVCKQTLSEQTGGNKGKAREVTLPLYVLNLLSYNSSQLDVPKAITYR